MTKPKKAKAKDADTRAAESELSFGKPAFQIALMAGLFVEYEWSSAWGLTVFLGLFFATFWLAWILTVFVVDRVQPKAA